MRANEFIAEVPDYGSVPSTAVPGWIKQLPRALTGNVTGKFDAAMNISKIVQVLKKQEPGDYNFDSWNNQRLIDTAKDLLTGKESIPATLPQDQIKDLQALTGQTKQQTKQNPPPVNKPKKDPMQQQQQQVKKTQPTPKPVQQQQQQPDLPSTLAPLTKVEPGATMTIGNKKITFDGKVWTDLAGQKYGRNPESLAQLNKAYLGYENARRATEVLKIQAKASQNRGNN
jgi:hypothetical protein